MWFNKVYEKFKNEGIIKMLRFLHEHKIMALGLLEIEHNDAYIDPKEN